MDLISYYSGNIKFSKCKGHLTYDQFIDVHKNPKPHIIELINKIKQASLDKNKELKSELKKGLFAFTPSVFINRNVKRRYVNIVKFNRYKQLDFDNIPDIETAIKLKNHIFEENPEILCAYLSPSSLGVKCLLKTARCGDIEQFRAMHKAIESHFNVYEDYFDSSVKNAILPLFLSIDRGILHRDFNNTKAWVKEDWSKTEYVNLNEAPVNYANKYDDKQKQYYLDKTVRLFTEKIRAIASDGHPQMRRACLILGSRCGAGYIDRFEAEQLAEYEIKSNQYMSKDIKNYITTSKWAINQGIKNPKNYN